MSVPLRGCEAVRGYTAETQRFPRQPGETSRAPITRLGGCATGARASGFSWFLRWIIVPLLLLPMAVAAGARPQALGPLEASGVIRAREVTLASELAGKVQSLPVAEGDAVAPGDLLVLLDDGACRANLAQAGAGVQAAQADLAVARAGARPEELAAAEAQVAQAAAALAGARAARQDATAAKSSPQELEAQVAAARAQVAGAEQALEAARAEAELAAYERDQLPYNSRPWQAAEFLRQSKAHAVTAAEGDLSAARIYLEGLEAIRSRPLQLLAAEHQAAGGVAVAEAALAVAQARLEDLQAGPTSEDVAVAEAKLRLAEAQATALSHQCERLTLRSPVEGTVLARLAQPGEAVLPSAPLLRLGDLRRVELVLYVPEPRVGEVTLGEAVEVRVDSYPERVFSGRVTRIADQPEYTPRNVATREERINLYYTVWVSLPNPDGALKPGMPADAVFVPDGQG